MGNLVTLTLYTDELDQVQKHPKEFADAVYEHACRGGGKRMGFLPEKFGNTGSFIMQDVKHSSVSAIYLQSGNTVTEIGRYSDDVERLLENNLDILEDDVKYIQSVITDIKKRIKAKKEENKINSQ
jgi:hypothetical protein